MGFNGQDILDYQLAKLEGKASAGIPLKPKALEKWIAELPLLNIDQLAYQIPEYLQKTNQIKIADKQRFKILELLRPIVDHIQNALITRVRGSNLDLSAEFQETQWIANTLLSEIAQGYQRLLFNQSKSKPGLFNRTHYALLIERTSYYLGERICLAYMSSGEVPSAVWKDLHATHLLSLRLKLNTFKISDELAFYNNTKYSLDTIYKRIVFLSIVQPYSLRSAELEQLYYGLMAILEGVNFKIKQDGEDCHYFINLKQDYGPQIISSLKEKNYILFIDNTKIIADLLYWKETEHAPKSSKYKGMPAKLLAKVIAKLDGSVPRPLNRVERHNNEQVELIIGLQKIDLFLRYKNGYPVEDVIVEPEVVAEPEVLSLNNNWGERVEDDWDNLHYFTSLASAAEASEKIVAPVVEQFEMPEIERHTFNIENESETGVCLSCSNQISTGLFIGELMYMHSDETEIWMLGIVRWMKVKANKLIIGLHYLSSDVERASVTKHNLTTDITIEALFLTVIEYGKTLLLPASEFETDEQLQLNYRGEEIDIRLGNIIWSSDGFSQFRFILENNTESAQEDKSDLDGGYTRPDWAKK